MQYGSVGDRRRHPKRRKEWRRWCWEVAPATRGGGGKGRRRRDRQRHRVVREGRQRCRHFLLSRPPTSLTTQRRNYLLVVMCPTRAAELDGREKQVAAWIIGYGFFLVRVRLWSARLSATQRRRARRVSCSHATSKLRQRVRSCVRHGPTPGSTRTYARALIEARPSCALRREYSTTKHRTHARARRAPVSSQRTHGCL